MKWRAAERAELEGQLRQLQAKAHHDPDWSGMAASAQRLQVGALRLQAATELRQFGGGHALGQLLAMEEADSAHPDEDDDDEDEGENEERGGDLGGAEGGAKIRPKDTMKVAIRLAQTITRTHKQQQAGVSEFVSQGTQSSRGKGRNADGLEAIGRYPQLRPAEEFKYEGRSKWKKIKKSMQVRVSINRPRRVCRRSAVSFAQLAHHLPHQPIPLAFLSSLSAQQSQRYDRPMQWSNAGLPTSLTKRYEGESESEYQARVRTAKDGTKTS
jgi:hypothetical protein